MDYESLGKMLKVMSDKNRIEILDLLSCGPMCANDILAYFNFSQPTLSHHMKQLKDVGLVTSWKESTKVMYANNLEMISELMEMQSRLFTPNERCICK